MSFEQFFTDTTARDWEQPVNAAPLDICVVGVGWFARTHVLPALATTDHCRASVAVSSSPEKAAAAVDQFGLKQSLTYEEFKRGRGHDSYDAVYVCTPNARHLEFIEAAAANGADVLCEKPLEATLERAERAVEMCAREGVGLTTAYRLQGDPIIRRLREVVAAGAIGTPVAVHGTYSFRLTEGANPENLWRLDPALAGGGALMDIGIYPLNTTRFLLDADPVAVQATTASTHDPFDDVEEHVTAELTFSDGVSATLAASYGGVTDDRLSVVGTDGKIVVSSAFEPAHAREVELHLRGDGDWATYSGNVNEVIEMFDQFAATTLVDSSPALFRADGLTDVRVIEAIYDAAASGTRQSISE